MKTILYYYSGTGNSLWIARELARRLEGETELVSLSGDFKLPETGCERLGLIFPVHIWGLPRRVVDFVNRLPELPGCYFFALAVNAGQVAATLLQLRRMAANRGLELRAGFDMPMPSNYIPWGGAQPPAKQAELFAAAKAKLDRAAAMIAGKVAGRAEQGPWWQNLVFSAVNRWTFNKVPGVDKDFWTEETCNGCGMCARVCPAGNIRLEGGRPVWQHGCEQCLACLQWCPQEAIQYAKQTAGKKRYHHPEVSAADMMVQLNKD